MIKPVLINFYRFISPVFNAKTLIKQTGNRVFLPFYHSISNDNPAYIKNIYPVRNEKIFINDLDFFCKNFKPVDLDFIVKKQKNDKPVFYLSFDDGLSEVYDIIAPILIKKGISASFFINTDFVDNKDLFYRYKASLIIEKYKNTQNKNGILNKINNELNLQLNNKNFIRFIKSVDYNSKNILDKTAPFFELDFDTFLRTEKPYLNSEQIKELIKQGFTIGSHSCSHPEYRTITIDEQIKQTKESMEFITEKFNIKSHKIFSFPFTDFGVSKDFFNTIYKNKIIDFSFGSAGLKDDVFDNHFQRFSIDGTIISADKLVKAEYLYFLTKKLFNKNKINR